MRSADYELIFDSLIVGYFGRQKYFNSAKTLLEESLSLRATQRPSTIDDRLHGHTLEQILKIFYESAQFGVPPFFTEFGDRLKQLSNEYNSMAGTYSTNQRLLYGKHVVSRRCNNMVASTNNPPSHIDNRTLHNTSANTLNASKTNNIACPPSLLESTPATQPIIVEEVSMSTEERGSVTDQAQPNPDYSEQNGITSPVPSPDNQKSIESPEQHDCGNQPRGRDACSINQTIRAHVGKRKRREPVSLHQRLKHSLLAPQTVQMIASMANENNTCGDGETAPNAVSLLQEDSLFSCLGDNLERYVYQENLQDLLANYDNDDWFKDCNFDELETAEGFAENACDPKPSTSNYSLTYSSSFSEHTNLRNEADVVEVNKESSAESPEQVSATSATHQSESQSESKRTSWKLVALSPIKRTLKYHSRNPTTATDYLEPNDQTPQQENLPVTPPIQAIKSPARKKKKGAQKSKPLTAQQVSVEEESAIASITESFSAAETTNCLPSTSSRPNLSFCQANKAPESSTQKEVSAEELDKQMRSALQDLLAPMPHLERPKAPQISLSSANRNFVLSQPKTSSLSSLSQAEWSSTHGTRGEGADRREKEMFCLVAASVDPMFYSCSSTSSSVSENIEPSRVHTRQKENHTRGQMSQPNHLLSKPNIPNQNTTPVKQSFSEGHELTMEDGEISCSPVSNLNTKEDHHSTSTTFTEDDEDGIIITYNSPAPTYLENRRNSGPEHQHISHSRHTKHNAGYSQREPSKHSSPERRASSRHLDNRQRVMREYLPHSSGRCRTPPRSTEPAIAPYSVICVDPAPVNDVLNMDTKETRYEKRRQRSSERCSSSKTQSRYSPQKRSGSSRRYDSPKKRNTTSRRPPEKEEHNQHRRGVVIKPSAAPKRPPV